MEIPFPAGETPSRHRVADWVELQALTSRSPYKRGDLRSAITIEDLSNSDLLEVRVWDELQARSSLFAENWPLRLEGAFLRRRRPSPLNLVYYKYLLCLSLGLVEKADRELFELLVANALTGLTTHPSIHVGAPASPGMDASFRERVKAYAASSELIEDEEYHRAPLPTDKDLGLELSRGCRFETVAPATFIFSSSAQRAKIGRRNSQICTWRYGSDTSTGQSLLSESSQFRLP